MRIPETLKHRDIPLDQLRQLYPGKRITVGVAIIAESSVHPSWKLLLLQRSDDEETLPSMYELPGGNCEPEDGTIFDAVSREAREETGLVISEVLSEFEEFEYSTKRGAAKQLNFLVRVREMPEGPLVPTLHPEEHQTYVWLESESPSILDSLPMTPGMNTVVNNALEAGRKIGVDGRSITISRSRPWYI
ncbi:NUDIX hydrolase domain-like protein [Mycena galericulata]|nr:NUDIX hydrolase domain-like protein [Mycena galericulata]